MDQSKSLYSPLPTIKAIVTDRLQFGDSDFDLEVLNWIQKASSSEIGLAFECCQLQNYQSLKPLPQGLNSLDRYISHHWYFDIDVNLCEASKQFYLEHIGAIFLVLGTYSLPFCYQSAEGAQVLFHSKRLYQDPLSRLAETAQFMSAVYSEVSSDQISEPLRAVLLRVRLVHSLVRAICKRYQLDFIPINQTEVIGTGLAFSTIVLRGLRKLGIQVDKRITDGWLTIWNNISYELGVSADCLPSDAPSAWAMAETISQQCFKPNEYAPQLTAKLAEALDNNLKGKSIQILVPTALQIMKYFLGSKASLLIGIPQSVEPASTFQIQVMTKMIDREVRHGFTPK